MTRLHALSWHDFDKAVSRLAAMVPSDVTALYGIPRGGLALAVALSHLTGLPLATQPGPGVLLVDEIADSGKTLAALRAEHGPLPALVWVKRRGCPRDPSGAPTVSDLHVVDGIWLVFPWEDRAKAAEECAAYAAR